MASVGATARSRATTPIRAAHSKSRFPSRPDHLMLTSTFLRVAPGAGRTGQLTAKDFHRNLRCSKVPAVVAHIPAAAQPTRHHPTLRATLQVTYNRPVHKAGAVLTLDAAGGRTIIAAEDVGKKTRRMRPRQRIGMCAVRVAVPTSHHPERQPAHFCLIVQLALTLWATRAKVEQRSRSLIRDAPLSRLRKRTPEQRRCNRGRDLLVKVSVVLEHRAPRMRTARDQCKRALVRDEQPKFKGAQLSDTSLGAKELDEHVIEARVILGHRSCNVRRLKAARSGGLRRCGIAGAHLAATDNCTQPRN
eukprot:scaffold109789_cov75-Phaeocystis_antarctica.AAC.3